MLIANAFMIFFLLALMIAALVLARLAQEYQESNVIRLYRLAALDRRRLEVQAVLRALKALDDNAEIARLLMQALSFDVNRIQKLDPGRGDMEQELRKLAAGASASAADDARGDKGHSNDPAVQKRSKVDRRTSLSSEREIHNARGHISAALAIIRRQYQARQIGAEQLESSARHLGLLSALVGVNSYMYMAEQAQANSDPGKALGYLRIAETYLHNGPLQGAEAMEKLGLVQQRKEQLLALGRSNNISDFAAN
jgi:hypothetical protein